MDLQLEKQHIIDRLRQTNDEMLIMKIKGVLDGSNNQVDELLEASITRGLIQSKRGEVTPHDQVIKRIKLKHNL